MTQNAITGREEQRESQTTVGPVVARAQSAKQTEVYLYDFTTMGGAVGDIFLRGHALPKGAVITNSYMDVLTALSADAGENVAVTVESAGDVQAAAARNGAPWSTTGIKDTTNPEPGTESGYIKTTAIRAPKIVVSTTKLSQGKFYLVLEYDVTGS